MENKTGITDEQLEKAAEKYPEEFVLKKTFAPDGVDANKSIREVWLQGAKYILSHSVDRHENNELKIELGLEKIAYQHQNTLLQSCEGEIERLRLKIKDSVDRGREAQD